MRSSVVMTLLLSACVAPAPAAQDTAAVIANASVQTHAEIQRVISAALRGAPVTIAADALTNDSFIAIERASARDERGRLLNGRDPGRPEIFELRKQGRRCMLLQQSTGERVVLSTASCSAKAATSIR
jgi:hypothetical protein